MTQTTNEPQTLPYYANVLSKQGMMETQGGHRDIQNKGHCLSSSEFLIQ